MTPFYLGASAGDDTEVLDVDCLMSSLEVTGKASCCDWLGVRGRDGEEVGREGRHTLGWKVPGTEAPQSRSGPSE